MGLFFKGKKKNKDFDDMPIRFENADSSDDAFLVSAVNSDGDFFESPEEEADKTRGYGANSGLAYINKYSSTNQKLATTKVVDVGAYKKPVKEPEKVAEPLPEVKNEETVLDEEDILLKPVDENDNEKADDDFDSFFEDFMKRAGAKETEAKQKEKEEEKQESVAVKEESKPVMKLKKPPVKRKKKRAIDIDIISGGIGGDII